MGNLNINVGLKLKETKSAQNDLQSQLNKIHSNLTATIKEIKLQGVKGKLQSEVDKASANTSLKISNIDIKDVNSTVSALQKSLDKVGQALELNIDQINFKEISSYQTKIQGELNDLASLVSLNIDNISINGIKEKAEQISRELSSGILLTPAISPIAGEKTQSSSNISTGDTQQQVDMFNVEGILQQQKDVIKQFAKNNALEYSDEFANQILSDYNNFKFDSLIDKLQDQFDNHRIVMPDIDSSDAYKKEIERYKKFIQEVQGKIRTGRSFSVLGMFQGEELQELKDKFGRFFAINDKKTSIDGIMSEIVDIANKFGFDMGSGDGLDVLQDQVIKLADIVQDYRNLKADGGLSFVNTYDSSSDMEHFTNSCYGLIEALEDVEKAQTKVNNAVSDSSSNIANRTLQANPLNIDDEVIGTIGELQKRVDEIRETASEITNIGYNMNNDGRILSATISYKNELGQITKEVMGWEPIIDEFGEVVDEEFVVVRRSANENIGFATKKVEELQQKLNASMDNSLVDPKVISSLQNELLNVNAQTPIEDIKKLEERIKSLSGIDKNIVSVQSTIDKITTSIAKISETSPQATQLNMEGLDDTEKQLLRLQDALEKLQSGQVVGDQAIKTYISEANNSLTQFNNAVNKTNSDMSKMNKQALDDEKLAATMYEQRVKLAENRAKAEQKANNAADKQARIAEEKEIIALGTQAIANDKLANQMYEQRVKLAQERISAEQKASEESANQARIAAEKEIIALGEKAMDNDKLANQIYEQRVKLAEERAKAEQKANEAARKSERLAEEKEINVLGNKALIDQKLANKMYEQRIKLAEERAKAEQKANEETAKKAALEYEREIIALGTQAIANDKLANAMYEQRIKLAEERVKAEQKATETAAKQARIAEEKELIALGERAIKQAQQRAKEEELANRIANARITSAREREVAVLNQKSSMQSMLDDRMNTRMDLGVNVSYLNELQERLNNINTNTAESEIKELQEAIKNLKSGDTQILQLQKAIDKLKTRLNTLYEKRDLDIITDVELREVNAMEAELSNLNSLIDDLSAGATRTGTQINTAINSATQSMNNLTVEATETRGVLSTVGDVFRSAMSTAIGFNIGSMMQNQLNNAKEAVLALDNSMKDLRRVTNLSSAEYDELTKRSNEVAISLGRTTVETLDTVTAFVKLGNSVEDSKTYLSEAALTFANVADISVEESINAITSTMKGFRMEAQEVTNVIDVMNEAGNRFALSSADLAEGLRIGAASLAIAGNDLAQSSALITAGTEVLQSPEKVANGLKTISINFCGLVE